MDLVIAEKPSVARDLARVLGVPRGGDWFENDRWAITWCIGHLVELEEPAAYDESWKPWRFEVLPMLPRAFELKASKHAKAQLKIVAKLLKDKRFAGVVNACDAGREGELIFRYVYQYARSKLPVRRLWISSLTDDAIRRGFGGLRPGRELEPLADAARSRSEADWLVGMNATRAMTLRNRREDAVSSIGRVQTPTLALLVNREREIRSFVPRDYWEVRGRFRTAEGVVFEALWRHGKQPRLAKAELADAIVERDRDAVVRVVDVRAKTVREAPPQLFDLTSLQRTANRRFGWSAARTLELAQALYEQHKVITYPRTDSRHLSSDVAQELPAVFEALVALPELGAFAQRLVEQPPVPGRRIVDDSKVSDHHAIIPTGTIRTLPRDEARLFDLIARRFLGAFYPDAEIAVTEAWIRAGEGEGKAPPFEAAERETFVEELPPPPDHYLARGRVRLVAGWQEVAGFEERRPQRDDREDDPQGALPPLVKDQLLEGRYAPVAKQTTPPPRHTEATLLAAMESAGKSIDDEALRAAMKDVGLGTPATRAAIIETLLRRNYIVRDKQHLVPTDAGMGLLDALAAANVSTLASPELTGSWEARLARIARGEDSRSAFMADIERYVTSVIDALRGAPSAPRPPASSMPPATSNAPRNGSGSSWNESRHGSSSSSSESRHGEGGRRKARSKRSKTRDDGKRARSTKTGSSRARRGSTETAQRSVRATQPRSVDPSDRHSFDQQAGAFTTQPVRTTESGSVGRTSHGSFDRTTGSVNQPASSDRTTQPGSVERTSHGSFDRRAGAAPLELQRAGADLSPAEGTRAVLDAIAGLSPIATMRRPATPSSTSEHAISSSTITRRPDSLPRTVSAPEETAALRCPRCKQGSLIEGQRGWGCDRWREGCRFVIWFETAGRRLTRAQFEALVTKGKTRKATFVDARGTELEGRLVLDPAAATGVQLVPA